jgi:hypothetical protein
MHEAAATGTEVAHRIRAARGFGRERLRAAGGILQKLALRIVGAVDPIRRTKRFDRMPMENVRASSLASPPGLTLGLET